MATVKPMRQKDFTAREAAEATGYGRSTIRAMLRHGKLKGTPIDTARGPVWMISPEEVARLKAQPKYLEQRTRKRKKP